MASQAKKTLLKKWCWYRKLWLMLRLHLYCFCFIWHSRYFHRYSWYSDDFLWYFKYFSRFIVGNFSLWFLYHRARLYCFWTKQRRCHCLVWSIALTNNLITRDSWWFLSPNHSEYWLQGECCWTTVSQKQLLLPLLCADKQPIESNQSNWNNIAKFKFWSSDSSLS